MATKKRPAKKSRVRQTTVKEAIAFLNTQTLDGKAFDRVITAIRDPQEPHILKTIVLHEAF